MQTFLPYPDFSKSAECLDYRRLGKQRVEAWQILQTLIGNSSGWKNHPAVKMWRGREFALKVYGIVICTEWRSRGYKDSMLDRFNDLRLPTDFTDDEQTKPPTWIGNSKFHASHRSNLLRKNPDWYRQFGWSDPDNLPYIWPIAGEK